MIRQLSQARKITLTNEQIEALIQDNFWDSCFGGCLGLIVYVFREFLSKFLFFLEWRRAINLIGITYYTGFLIDAALLDSYPLTGENGSTWPAEWLRESIRRARYGANLRLIQRLVRDSFQPFILLRAAWAIIKTSVASIPRLIIALPGSIWQGIKGAPCQVASEVTSLRRKILNIPRQIQENFRLRIQVFLGKEKAPEIRAIERIVQSMQTAILKLDTTHFDDLHNRLISELNRFPE